MSYTDLINDSIGKVYQKGIATKILQHMDKIRNVSDISLARRWVMELFQNSRDVAYDDQPVKIKIELKDETVSFLHNGRAFRVKDILSIINQVSSKNPDENTVGQFGTGFMTTYQLSEEVEIKSILKDGDLPYKPFSIHINRRGSSQETILDEIGKSMEELKLADGCPEVQFVKEAYNTEFLYHLDSRESYQTAKTGMDDLKSTILYVLLFSERIAQVELIYNTKEEQKQIVYKRQGVQEFTKDLRVLHISCEQLGKQENYSLVYYETDGLTLAAEWKEECGFVPISDSTPKLFVDFPLIGAENFPFPIVINHRGFHTNEPRSGIALVDNVSSNDSIINKNIMMQAVEAYKTYLHQVVEKDCRGIEHIVTMPEWEKNKEHSETWVKCNLYRKLYKIISREPFIETEQGKLPLNTSELYIISGETEKEKEELKQLVNVLKCHIVAIENIDWYSIFYPFLEFGFSEEKVIFLKSILINASKYLYEKLDEEKMDALAWCQKLYAISMKNTELAMQIKAGSIEIFPNQNKEMWQQRKLCSILHIKKDPNIPEILKDVCEELDKLSPNTLENPLQIRNCLLHQEFNELGIAELQTYEITRMENHIIRRSNRNMKVVNYSYYYNLYETAWHKAWCLLLSCSSEEKLYQLSKVIYKENLMEYEPLKEQYDISLWKNTYVAILQELLQKIEQQSNLEKLQQFLGMEEKEEVYEWLNGILEYSANNVWDCNMKCVFPNQKGTFLHLYNLKKDNVEDELKEIINEFADQPDCDVYSILLDKNIISEKFQLGEYTDKDVADILNRTIQGLLANQNLANAKLRHQEACTRLLGWIQENIERAVRYFPSFSNEEDQMKLLTPKAAVNMQKKANALNTLMKQLGVESEEELLKRALELEKKSTDSFSDWNHSLDVFLGSDIICSVDEIDTIIREVGTLGEQYALEQIKQYFVLQGYQISIETNDKICMEKQEEIGIQKVEIEYPDTKTYHQAGWDIKVVLQSADSFENIYYIEVKTHTPKSEYRDRLMLSNEQMKLAMQQMDNYVVLVVTYNYNNRVGVSVVPYQNVAKQIGAGTIRNSEKYVFYV